MHFAPAITSDYKLLRILQDNYENIKLSNFLHYEYTTVYICLYIRLGYSFLLTLSRLNSQFTWLNALNFLPSKSN